MKTPGIIAVAAFFLAATGGAEATTPEAETGAGTDESKKEKKVCKSEKITGSLTRVRRICMTEAEWTDLAQNTNRALDRLGRSANQAEALRGTESARAAAGAGL